MKHGPPSLARLIACSALLLGLSLGGTACGDRPPTPTPSPSPSMVPDAERSTVEVKPSRGARANGEDAVDIRVTVLQADGTRCGGVTGFLYADALAEAFDVPLSAHTAPSLHGHLGCACKRVRNVEYFHDHARIERMLFDGALVPAGGELRPDPSIPGIGLHFRRADAERYLA